jgi:hypothetical protein
MGPGLDLVAGESYWLAISFTGAGFGNAPTWWVSDDALSVRSAALTGATWRLQAPNWQPAFRIAVPAPGAAAVLFCVAASAARRRRN